MLHLLRKVRKSLIESGSLRKYILYAIGEVLLVVVGILIALQINNWNEDNKARKQETQILKSIHAEYITNLKSLKGAESRAKRLEERCLGILQHTGANFNDLGRNESDSMIILGVADFISVELTDAIRKDLLSTGRINLLQNDSLIYLLNDWDTKVLEVREIENIIYSENSTIIYPFLQKHYSLATEQRTTRLGFKSGFPNDHRQIYQLNEFENIVVRKMRLLRILQRDYRFLESVINSILSLAKSELEGKEL